MWYALRAELAYGRPWLLGSLGIGAGVSILVTIVFLLVDSDAPGHVAAGLRGMFLIMAPSIAAFIVQAYRLEERRSRLLLAGPLTPRQIAGVTVLLPTILFGIGVAAAAVALLAEILISGRLEAETLHMVGYVGGLLFMMTLMGPLAQEALAAHRQRRRRAAAAGWATFVAAVLFLVGLSVAATLLQGPLTWASLHIGNFIVAAAAMAAGIGLHAGRTDFTR